MHRAIDIRRLVFLVSALSAVLGMAHPPNRSPEQPILGGLSADDTSISGIVTECIDPNDGPDACELTIEVYSETMALLNAKSVSAPNWTLAGLQPETTYLLIARASDGAKTASTGPYAYATAGAPPADPSEFPYPGVIPANEHVGSLKGMFEVGDSGAALYRLAIIVPPGTAGLEPALAIQYNSQVGNGTLGTGFALAGLGAITRCPPTDFLNGDSDPVDFDDSDLFCLAGERLVLTGGGAYGADGAEYRTTMDSFAKVTSKGGANNDPDYFEVREKNGRIVEYGATADSRIEVQGRSEKRAWALNKISDRSGNYLTIAYHEDAALGEYWPVRIDYTANDSANQGAGSAAYNKVIFEYGGPPADPPDPTQWPSRPDVISGYFAGGLIENRYRLTNIKTYARGDSGPASDLVFDYRITYEQDLSTGVSRITQISQCTSAAPVGPCLPPARFTWSDDTLLYSWSGDGWGGGGGWIPAIPSSSTLTAWVNTHDGYVIPGDINGGSTPFPRTFLKRRWTSPGLVDP
jgi:hypothetical protein